MTGTYYFKDRDQNSRTIYVLIENGVRVGTRKTKKEAESWFRTVKQSAVVE